jgi:hypothetical protein
MIGFPKKANRGLMKIVKTASSFFYPEGTVTRKGVRDQRSVVEEERGEGGRTYSVERERREFSFSGGSLVLDHEARQGREKGERLSWGGATGYQGRGEGHGVSERTRG